MALGFLTKIGGLVSLGWRGAGRVWGESGRLLAGTLLAAALWPAAGCGNLDLDAKIAKVDERAAAYSEAFAGACDGYAKINAELGDKKHDLQKQIIDATGAAWIKTNTDAAGQFTCTAADLNAFLANRDAAVVQLNQSRAQYAEANRKFSDAVAQFRATWTLLRDKKAEYEETKRSVQALSERVIDFVAGAAVVGGAAAVAP